MAEQGKTYADHIEGELKAEYDRTTALNGRAAAVTTTSTAFLALVVALVTLVAGRDFKVAEAGARAVAVSLALFAAASIAGFIAALSRKYEVTAIETLLKMIDDHWADHEVDARNIVAYTNVATISSLREGNNFKVNFLTAAAVLQLAAVAFLLLGLVLQFSPLL